MMFLCCTLLCVDLNFPAWKWICGRYLPDNAVTHSLFDNKSKISNCRKLFCPLKRYFLKPEVLLHCNNIIFFNVRHSATKNNPHSQILEFWTEYRTGKSLNAEQLDTTWVLADRADQTDALQTEKMQEKAILSCAEFVHGIMHTLLVSCEPYNWWYNHQSLVTNWLVSGSRKLLPITKWSVWQKECCTKNLLVIVNRLPQLPKQ